MDLASRSAMNGLSQDLKGALRLLVRSPAFAGAVILTLAVAIGATTAVFSVVRGLLLGPLPFREPDRLVRLFNDWQQFPSASISPVEYHDDLPRLARTSSIAAWTVSGANLSGEGAPEHVRVGRATSTLLPTLGVLPALGRWFLTARLFAGLLFGVGTADPLALLLAVATLGTVAAIASLLPARRAARVDPAIALHAE